MAMRLAALALAFLAASCAHTGRPDPVDARTLADVDAKIAERQAAIKNMDADISMTVDGLENSGSFSGKLFYGPPDRFRMEAYKQVGPHFASFLMLGDRFQVFIIPEKRLVRGSVREQARKRPELMAAFIWLAERPEPGDERTLEEAGANLDIVTRRAGRLVRRTHVEKGTLFVTGVTLFDENGAEIARVSMQEYRKVNPPEAFGGEPAWIPWRIEIRGKTDAGRSYTVKMKMRIVYINEGIEKDTFELTIPEGTTIEEPN